VQKEAKRTEGTRRFQGSGPMIVPDCKHGEAVEVRNGLTRFSRNGTRPQAKENRFHATASCDGSWLSKANVQTAVDHSNTRSTVTYQTSAFSCDKTKFTIRTSAHSFYC